MIKLNKTQSQAIINRLGREECKARENKLAELRANYEPSPNIIELTKLLKLRNKYVKEVEALNVDIKTLVVKITSNRENIYYINYEDILDKMKEYEVNKLLPEKIDLNKAQDDLIIMSLEDDFDVNNFISTYLKDSNL